VGCRQAQLCERENDDYKNMLKSKIPSLSSFLAKQLSSNGCCLFNSVSLILAGYESLETELRYLKMAAHRKFYLSQYLFSEAVE